MENKNKEVKKYTDVNELIQDLLDYKVVINTETEQQAEEFVKVMRDKHDMGWEDGSYDTCYNKFEEDTCYTFRYGKNKMAHRYIAFCRQLAIPYSKIRNLLISSSTTNTNNTTTDSNDSKLKPKDKLKLKLKIDTKINHKDVDWKRVKNKCRVTVNKDSSDKEATEEFKRKLLISEHSPIRVLRVDWSWKGIPYCYSTHYVRHHEGVEKWVGTERSDRTGVDRNTLPQTNPVNLDMESNAQGLINMGKVRLCNQASVETRQYYENLKVTLHNDEDTKEIANVLVPNCIYRFGCPEKFGDNKCKKFIAFLEYANKKGYSLENLSDLQTRYDVYNEWFYETHK